MLSVPPFHAHVCVQHFPYFRGERERAPLSQACVWATYAAGRKCSACVCACISSRAESESSAATAWHVCVLARESALHMHMHMHAYRVVCLPRRRLCVCELCQLGSAVVGFTFSTSQRSRDGQLQQSVWIETRGGKHVLRKRALAERNEVEHPESRQVPS